MWCQRNCSLVHCKTAIISCLLCISFDVSRKWRTDIYKRSPLMKFFSFCLLNLCNSHLWHQILIAFAVVSSDSHRFFLLSKISKDCSFRQLCIEKVQNSQFGVTKFKIFYFFCNVSLFNAFTYFCPFCPGTKNDIVCSVTHSDVVSNLLIIQLLHSHIACRPQHRMWQTTFIINKETSPTSVCRRQHP